MLFVDQETDIIDDMGYTLSKLDMESETLDRSSSNHGRRGTNPWADRQSNPLDNDIVQLTKLQSCPQESYRRVQPWKREFPVSTPRMLAGREMNLSGRGRFSSGDCRYVLNKYLPVNGPCVVDEMSSRAYVSQFSADGSLFIAAFQGRNMRIYDVENGWKVQKNIVGTSTRWTITDTSLSPDQRHLVYASMSPIVHIVDVGSSTKDSLANVTGIHEDLDFSYTDGRGYSFGIFSLKFSTDGREIVAGTNDEDICVYDLEAKKLSLRILAHMSDVNTVCFADESGHLIYSGSDDNFCKVWDRRCFRTQEKPAGVLMGHFEGITFIDSRGDGRYFISNGKDQAIKLWDIRKMSSNSIWYDSFKTYQGYKNYDWDYRWMDYPLQSKNLRHPYDQSVSTYKGHSVLRTLIRCYFSPVYSTGQKYIYTGSHDSCVYIYDVISGALVAKLQHHRTTVRDCSWHPKYPMLVSSSWDGDIVKWGTHGNEEGPPPENKRRLGRRHF